MYLPGRTRLALLLLTVCLAACGYDGAPSRIETSADSTEGEIAFDLVGAGDAALVVPVFLNGAGPHPFVLDTGATLTCINESLADSLGLPSPAGQVGYGAGVGGAGNVRLVTVDSLRVGETRAFDLTACALDLAQLEQAGLRVDGLLGLNFLKSFRMTLDFGDNTLRLEALQDGEAP